MNWKKLIDVLLGGSRKTGRAPVCRGPLPDRRTDLQTGFWWKQAGARAIAAGQGWNYDAVGEASYQTALERMAGGRSTYGANVHVIAQLVIDQSNRHDANAVGVMIDATLVGYVPRDDALAIKNELIALSSDGAPVTCKAQINGGWDRGLRDRGHFGVKLSLARPLRERTR